MKCFNEISQSVYHPRITYNFKKLIYLLRIKLVLKPYSILSTYTFILESLISKNWSTFRNIYIDYMDLLFTCPKLIT